MKHILSIDQFSKKQLKDIMLHAFRHSNGAPWLDQQHDRLRIGWLKEGDGPTARYYPSGTYKRILTNLFYEPSTRTSSSFASAMLRLGGQVIPINEAGVYSSAVKGESLEDTIRTIQCYSDLIVIRHPEVDAAQRAANVATVPIINAGDGTGEHPTQALLDFFTILMERSWKTGIPSKIDVMTDVRGLNVTMMGDLKYGRTVKSLAKLGRMFEWKINWVSPAELKIPSEFLQDGEIETEHLDDVLADTEVLYVTRVQKERMANAADFSYGVTLTHMAKAKADMVLMHPLPRVTELPTSLDDDPRSAYFRQMKYGLYMRMGLLEMVMEG